MKKFLAGFFGALLCSLVLVGGVSYLALAQQGAFPNHAIPLGQGSGVVGYKALPPSAIVGAILRSNGASADPSWSTGSEVTACSPTAPITCSILAGTMSIGITTPLALNFGGTNNNLTAASGGVVWSDATKLNITAVLTASRLMLGGGAGAGPSVLGSLGTTTTLLHGNAGGVPTFGAVVSADLNITTTTCTNQFLTAISATGTGTCTTDTLASAQHANQGTATTVLHGNAAGNPAFGAVVNADLNTMLTNTVKGNATAGTATPTDLAVGSCSTAASAVIWTTNTGWGCNTSITAATANNSGLQSIKTTGVNFNVGATDTAVTITLPTGFTRYLVSGVRLSGASGTLTTATMGLFTAVGGGGIAVVADSAITVSTAAENTANNAQPFTSGTIASSESINAATLYIRVGTPQGVAATGVVTLYITPLS